MKYRKKPIVIDAEKVSDLLKMYAGNWTGLPSWASDAYEEGVVFVGNDHLKIKTLEGTMEAKYDDYLIRGVQGELYPCKPDIFEATYELVIDD